MSFKSGFESRERELQFNTAGGSEFQVTGAAVLNDRLPNDVRRNGKTAVGRMTIECCVRWCATRCVGSDSAEMTSAVSACKLVVDALFNRQPVQRLKQREKDLLDAEQDSTSRYRNYHRNNRAGCGEL